VGAGADGEPVEIFFATAIGVVVYRDDALAVSGRSKIQQPASPLVFEFLAVRIIQHQRGVHARVNIAGKAFDEDALAFLR